MWRGQKLLTFLSYSESNAIIKLFVCNFSLFFWGFGFFSPFKVSIKSYTMSINTLRCRIWLQIFWSCLALPCPSLSDVKGGLGAQEEREAGMQKEGSLTLLLSSWTSPRAFMALKRGTVSPSWLCQYFQSSLPQSCFNPRCCRATRTRVSVPLLSSWLSRNISLLGKWTW